MVEGDTERGAKAHIKKFLDGRAGARPKVRLVFSAFHGGLNEPGVRGRAEKHLKSPVTLGIIAFTDLYPKFKTADEARRTIRSWMPDDRRCYVEVAKHDFEAALLVGWEAILAHAKVPDRKPWGPRPEDIDHDRPPAHRLRDLFQKGRPPHKYRKPVDGRTLFEKLDLELTASRCPEFKRFLNRLLGLAGYSLLP